MKTPMRRLTMFLRRSWQAAWLPAGASGSASGRECLRLLATVRIIAITLCALLYAGITVPRASAQSLTTYTSEASYTAALPAAGVTTTVENFASVTADRPVSTATPDQWSGFTLLARGTSQFGPSAYCASLSQCMIWTASPPALPGLYGAVSDLLLGNGQFTFDLAPRAFGFGLEYWDWNDEGQRSRLRVTLSNGAVFTITGPTSPAGAPGSFVGFRLDQASVNAGITITRVEWVAALLDAEVIGIRNVRVSTVNPLVVTNTNDSGPGSLRNAVQFANSQPTPTTITFAIPGAGPHTITLASALPDLSANGLIIDGTSQPGTQCRDLWAGNGHDLRINLTGSTGFDGLRLGGANQLVRGLSITNFADGVDLLAGSNTATLHCNYIGLLANGTSRGNASLAIAVRGASARIGGLDPGQGNVVSANGFGIITNAGSTDTAIRGNFIGTDATGMSARANTNPINNFNGAATWRDITRNLIAGNNGSAGIRLEPDDRITPSDGQIRIQRNIIGANRTLTALLRNAGDGIFFDTNAITGVLIGGTTSTEGNIITANDDGIDLRSVSNITIRGNTIAIAGARGINLNNVNTVEIGGALAGQGNAIGGNTSDGIYLANASANVTILANLIQPVATIGGTFANGGHGIVLDNTSNVTIGNGSASGRNIIAGNRRRGIFGLGTNTGTTITGNYIGTDASGNVAIIGGQNEGSATRDAISFDAGGTVSNLAITGNVIGGYDAALVELWTSNTNGVTIQGNNIGVGADGSSQIVPVNSEDLIYIGGGSSHSNLLIGGSGAGQGNVIAFSSRSGIRLETGGSNIQVIGNTIRNNSRSGLYLTTNTRAALVGNRIYANGMLGIDLGENGVTANDPADADSGANEQLNFPAITRAIVTAPGQLQYAFTLDAQPAANGYRIEFFANPAADPSGFGEGERYLGHVDIAHSGGAQSYSGTLATLQPVTVGEAISATTTRKTAGGAWDITSEFSAVATADGMAQLAVAITSEVFEPPAGNPFATPGNDMLLTTTVTNGGTGSTDPDSVFAVISISPDTSFFNAATPSLGGIVGFTSGAPSLTFNPATDLRFSNAPGAPQSLAQCTYTPVAGYDPQVRYVCLNPKGTLPAGGAQGQVQVRLRLRIN